jgi:hypothetical protein
MITLLNIYYGETEYDEHYDIVDINHISGDNDLTFKGKADLNKWIDENALSLLKKSVADDEEELSSGLYTMHFEYKSGNKVDYVSKDYRVEVQVIVYFNDVSNKSTNRKQNSLADIKAKLHGSIASAPNGFDSMIKSIADTELAIQAGPGGEFVSQIFRRPDDA